jgi:ribosomal protein S18 acetylase RimI-like enzyme
MTPTIRPIRAGEERRLAAVLAGALFDDPFIRWIAGNDYARAVTWMRAGIELARRHGLVLVDDALRGGALLVAPDQTPAPLRTNVALLPLMVRTVGLRRLPGVLRALTAIEHAHPDEPHWTGLVLGVDAAARGTGVGSALIEAAMDRVRRDQVGAYLEVSEDGPAALYERFGFTPLRRLTPPGGAPVMRTMWRPAPS